MIFNRSPKDLYAQKKFFMDCSELDDLLTTLRPKGRRFLQQDANVLAQQCF